MSSTKEGDAGLDLRGRLASVTRGSHSVAVLRRTANALPDSRLAATAAWLAHTTRSSFLYRWLTKEPEPEVIVVDLRDTYTVGPVIAVLDHLVTTFAPLWRTSTFKRTTDALVALGEATAETRTGRSIAKLLEPPEPPEDDR